MSELSDFRKAKDRLFATESDSPLTVTQKRAFSGLSYFDENPDLWLELEPQRFPDREIVEMQTSTGSVTRYVRWGSVEFQVDGRTARLTIFTGDRDHDLFLPFADATSGKETYGAGRYLEPQLQEDGKVLLDFNYAYNPYCAYNDAWSCPLTPWENRLKVPIVAGEKKFK